MKTISKLFPGLLPAIVVGSFAIATMVLHADDNGGYVAHEWGTFTSVQGGDGVLLDWHPLASSRLPKFVYDWTKPGLGRRPAGQLALTKVELSTLQRMETPVIYFYSAKEESVDVSVQFPKGLITEWYPQAAQIGPSSMSPSPLMAKLDECAHKAGAKPSFSFASLFSSSALSQSAAHWAHVQIVPSGQHQATTQHLPTDSSGSHYFAARGTDADYLRIPSPSSTNTAPEWEKFIFYRGVGNFATPLQAEMGSERDVKVTNSGRERLGPLLLLRVENGSGHFDAVTDLAPGESRTLNLSADKPIPLTQLSQQVAGRMSEGLVRQGLYLPEAAAMVATWKDSWFEEEGLRVLYVLPRAWTDQTLPLMLRPAPRQLVRVMVGRAEILSSSRERKLADTLARAAAGDLAARNNSITELRKLGRFASPAIRLATEGAAPATVQNAWELLRLANSGA